MPIRHALCIGLAASGLAACSSGDRAYDPMENLAQGQAAAPSRPSGQPASPASTDLRPALVVNGQAVAWEDVWEPMAEFSGGVVVSEVVLDTVLAEEMARRGITIGQPEVERERSALTRTIIEGVGVSDAAAQQLVRQVTLARGLGPHRMDTLLRRNAMLRVMARDSVVLTDDILRRAYDIEHGQRFTTRIITVADNREAAQIRSALEAGTADSLRARFSEAAVTHSTDSTGGGGGLLGALSPADTSLPAALRSSLESTPVGTMTPVLALDNSFGIAFIEAIVQPTGVPFESVRPALEVSVRERLERLQMEVIARELLDGARVSVFDRSLDWGWTTGRNR